MRQFFYAQRTHPPVHRGITAQRKQRDVMHVMSDMQGQSSKLAESTFRFPLSQSPLEVLFYIACGPCSGFASPLVQYLL